MRRLAFAFALALALPLAAALGAAGDPASASEAAGAPSAEAILAGWEAKLAEAHARIAQAREQVEARERAVTRARHRKHPRGDAFDELLKAADEARAELSDAEADLPALLEQARAAGVEPGVLRRFEPED
jgi:chromosome segregation ATPase